MDTEQSALDKKKVHRERHAGRKAEKKKAKNKHVQELTDKQKNPKAFTFNSAVRAERRFRRKQDIQTKKQHIPLVDRAPLEPPPVVVAIVGPRKVGKTTLMHCLIKHFTKQPMTVIKGPVTIVSGKRRRLTLIECNNDINSMIDVAKVADLVLLLVDASFGFEMEIFEFLNICQVHGMPRVMGVLTHLDMLKNAKQLKRTKKTLKHRFWTEVYAGAKLFYLSGLLHGEYLRNEIRNLGRFISVMKFRPLTWRTSHPYVLVDRMEDLTPPEMLRQNPKVDRTVSLYGFVRGIPLNKKSSVHIPGCGDLKIKDVSFLPDPCPLPDKLKKRSLVEKERIIYAPFCGIGGIVYDKDAVYVELGGSHSYMEKVEDGTKNLVSSLLDTQETLDSKIARSEVQLFSDAAPLKSSDVPEKSKGNKNNGKDDTSGKCVTNGVNVNEEEEKEEEEEEEDEDEEEEEEEEEEEHAIDGDSDVDSHNRMSSDDDDDDDEQVINQKKKRRKVTDKSIPKKKLRIEDRHKGAKTVVEAGCKNLDLSSNSVARVKKKLLATMGDSTSDSDTEESDIENNAVIDDTKEGCKTGLERTKNNDVSYHETSTVKDKEIKSRISEALLKLENSEKKKAWDEDVESSVSEYDSSDLSDLEDECSDSKKDSGVTSDGQSTEENSDNDSGSDEEAGESTAELSAARWKENLAQKAADAFLDRQANTRSLWKLVYGNYNKENEQNMETNAEEGVEEVGGLFRVVRQRQQQQQEAKELCDAEDCARFPITQLHDWSLSEVQELIRDCFVTGKWKQSEDAEELLKLDDVLSDDEMFGDFEDLETGEKHGSSDVGEHDKKSDQTTSHEQEDETSREKLLEKKRKLKEKFDNEYDEQEGGKTYYDELKQEADMQAQLNKSQFEGLDDDIRVELEGYRPGMYVRVELASVPCELVTHFDPEYPLIMGGLQPGEENVGYVQVRGKKHRWFPKILKTRDPLIVSLGWRRFQTLPIYAKLEDNLRHRYLKYTPQHVACMVHFWGPITPQGTGFLAVQNADNMQQTFRIALTGSVVELDKSAQILKKLKLTGTPLKIYKKTAFIKGMFSSALEVAKFEGAKIKTVSGIRGQIKKAASKPEGAFRATFEDKVQLSDIVFCRTWYKVDVPKFYNPVTSLLLPPDQKNLWRGMRTVGELKRAKGIRREPDFDSLYKPIERTPKVFPELVIPRSLQKQLPYKDKPKLGPVRGKDSLESKRIAVVREPHEQQVAAMMKMLKASYRIKQEKLKQAIKEKRKEHKKELEKEQEKLLRKQRELKKQFCRTVSKKKGEYKPKKRTS
ncbi:ribosome biogenesis protein BMS1 homolog [Schistocerca cancellata]|uniref:ribosome biogenesis protein BMS1 homolog n=1 Tax=Schistocerca cancellata TaxID=274614 RepID=UPI00211807D6|nr:ribosome biogenesis protein BMS1 homolog [Schistocerca cancellata]